MRDEIMPEKKTWIGGYVQEAGKTSYEFKKVVHNAHGGYVEDSYRFEISKDSGFLTIWNERSDFMNVDPEAIPILVQFLLEHGPKHG